MYSFFIKDNGPDLKIIITRAMLGLAAIAALVYRSDQFYLINLSATLILTLAAVFIDFLLVTFRISRLILLALAAVLLFLATRSIAFAVILLLYGFLVKFLDQKPTIEFTPGAIRIKKLFLSPAYQWNEFSNIILKDDLLTLDFKNNKLIQLSIDGDRSIGDENAFNDYCTAYLKK